MNSLLRLDRTTRLVILSLLLGGVGALAAQIFLWMLHFTETWILTYITGHAFLTVAQAHAEGKAALSWHPVWWIPVATTLGGLLSGFLVYTWAPEAEGHGTDAAVKAYHQLNGKVRARIPLIKSVASAITIGSGGSAGREGPTAQIAAGIGSVLGGILKLPEDERRYLVLAGMAAGLSAIFKSPLGTAVFGVEILYSGMAFEGGALIYTILASAVAYAITGAFEGWAPLFVLPVGISFNRSSELIWYLLLGVVSGAAGALLPWVFYTIRDAFHKLDVPNQIKPAIGGLALGLIGMFALPLLGGGYGWIQLAIDGKLAIWLMLALAFGKILALSLTVSSGGSGGVFAPSLYVGAMFGGALAAIIDAVAHTGPNPAAFAVVGMAALFAGAARVPVATLIMVAEMTGGYQLILPTMMAVAVSYVVQVALTRKAKYPSLYEAQVPRSVDSPAHHKIYYEAVANMLRQRKVRLDDDIVGQELMDRLSRGQGVPLMGGDEFLYSLELPADTVLAGQKLNTVKFPEGILLISILHDQEVVVPKDDTALHVGDRLTVAATPQAMEALRQMAQRAPAE